MSDKIQQIRDYVDNHDLSDEIEQGHWETDVADDISIELRNGYENPFEEQL